MKKSLLLLALLPAFGAPATATGFPASPPKSPTFMTAPTTAVPSVDPKVQGLYLHVIDGQIQVANSAGAQNLVAGQFLHVPSPTQPPVVLPSNPGMQFSPPSMFQSTPPKPTLAGMPTSGGVDCVVR